MLQLGATPNNVQHRWPCFTALAQDSWHTHHGQHWIRNCATTHLLPAVIRLGIHPSFQVLNSQQSNAAVTVDLVLHYHLSMFLYRHLGRKLCFILVLKFREKSQFAWKAHATISVHNKDNQSRTCVDYTAARAITM